MVRSAKESGNFPYDSRTICYIEVNREGRLSQVPNYKNDKQEVYFRVKSGESQLYAVWPGQYRSDLFIIDDIEDFAKAYKFI